MNKILLSFLLFLFFAAAINAQLKLQLPSEIPSDNLSYSQFFPDNLKFSDRQFESNLKLNIPVEISANSPQFGRLIRTLIMLNFIYGITTGELSDAYSGLIGAYLRFGYFLSSYIMLTGSLGYLNFIFKEDFPEGFDQSFYSIPILLGMRYFFTPAAGRLMIYALLQVGLHLLNSSLSYSFGDQNFDQSGSESKFGLHPGVGLMMALSSALMLDFNIQYMLIFTEGNSLTNLAFLLGLAYALGGGGSEM